MQVINDDYIIHKGNIVNRYTGEIVEDKTLLKELLREYNKYSKEIKATIKHNGNIQDLKDITIFNFNQKKRFIKLFLNESRERMNIKNLSKNALLLFYAILPHIEFYTNKVKINGASPSNDTLIELTNLNKNSLPKALKELEDKQILKRTGKGVAREIYLNPYICCHGQHLNKESHNLFNI